MREPHTPAPETVICPVCGTAVPDGEYCGACGATLLEGAQRPAQRAHAYAASPNEHLFHLGVVSTLFPHLPHRRSAPFRLALLVGAVVLVVLGYLRLTGPAVAAAALLVPVLYLLYLYEVEVYEESPALVAASTFLVGLIGGGIWAYLTGGYVTQTLLLNVVHGASSGKLLVAAVLFPLLALAVMLAGPLIVFFVRRYDEALDGFTFGAACALGFAFASTLVNLWPTLTEGLQTAAPPTDHALVILQRGLLIPCIYASVAGCVAGAWWLWRGRTRPLPARGWTTMLPVNAAIAVAVMVGLGFVNVYLVDEPSVVLIHAIVAAALLIWVRVALHHMLLAEAVEVGIGPDVPCSHCHRIVPRMAFCPHCGIATRATPKSGAGRDGRKVR